MRWILFVLVGLLHAAPEPPIKKRDLKVEREAELQPRGGVVPSRTLSKTVAVPRGYAVVIGVSDYKNLPESSDLKYGESDAKAVARTLMSQEAGNIDPENVRILVGADATLANILAALEDWLPSITQEQDRVIVYFVGHGVVDAKGRGYIAPYDIDPAHMDATAYPMDRLAEVLGKRIRARWKVLLTDACHSGKITPDTTDETVNSAFTKLPKTFLTLTSSREAERSYEDSDLAGGFGFFSYFLIKGWEGEADKDPVDGIVTADELVSYVRREVKMYARQRNIDQTPTERGDFDNNLVLGFSPDRRIRASEGPTPELPNGTLIIEVNLEDVEIYVDGFRVGLAAPQASLRVPGLTSGRHIVKATRLGYEPAVREVIVNPGIEQTVSLRVLHPRAIKPSARALYHQANEIWAKSASGEADLKRASAILIQAIGQQSDYSEAQLALCRIQQQQARTAIALETCRASVHNEPSYVEARTMYGALLIENGDHAEAVRQLSLAAEQSSSDAFVQSLLAEALFWTDRFIDAEKAASRAIVLSAKHAQGYLFRAESRRMMQKLDEAVTDYQEYLTTERNESGLGRKLAFYLVGSGMQKHRIGRKALFKSQRFTALFGLCAAELGRENYLRASDFCQRALRGWPDDSDTRALLGEVYIRLFNRDNRKQDLLYAKEHFEAALKANPNLDKAPAVRRQLAQVLEYLPLVH